MMWKVIFVLACVASLTVVSCDVAKPGCKCGLNEVSSNCTNGGCDARNCSQVGKPVPCVKLDPKSCIKGCVCQPGYLRTANGTCVPQNQCNNGCGNDPNAHSGCGVNCGRTCSTYKTKGVACILICNLNGCDCNDGFVFDPNVKKCVLPEQCTPTCGLNEVYSSCTNGGCGHRNCSQLGQPQLCIDRTPESCTKGCICASGYLRASNGTCIPQDKCPAPVAKPGYKCGLNEVSSNCTNGGCDARNCSQVGNPVPCVKLDQKSCIKGCVCQPGYLRTANGTCVPQNQCNNGCGNDPNAHSGCGVNCGRTCSTYKTKGVACIKICNINGCDCNDGFVLDPNVKKCVLPEQCTPTCGLNEVYSSCTNGGCGHRNCSQLGQPQLCIDRTPESCTKGCICSSGYLRASNGTCIPQDKCPAPGCGGDPNAQSGCGYNCGKTCTTYKAKKPFCPRIPCKPKGCDCKDGYVFDDNVGKCVLPQECSLTCDQPNEIYDSCPAPCPAQSCLVDPALVLCAPSPQYGDAACQPECRCIDGYARNGGNVCVPRNECPSADDQCPGQNEFFDTCISGCSNQTCETIGKIFNCPIQPAVCRTGCRCNPGFYRNASNVCVSESQCPSADDQCPGQNEFFDTCISGCSNQTCETIGKIFHCPLQSAVCRTGCRCNPGFYRNASNVCVSESQCPTPPCPVGEVYSRCPNVKCDGDYCPETRDSPLTCPVGIVCDQPRCVCGLLDRRDRKTGKCIRSSDCPPFKCDGPNEEYQSCPATCPGEKCTDYINDTKCSPFRIGIVVPCKPQCRCTKGYYRNSDGICILASQCAPADEQCPGQNEFFDSCISGCSNQTCETIGKIFNCPIQPAVCRTGCRCNPGFYRNASNVCVSESQCGCGGDPNAQSGCGYNCGKTCTTYKAKKPVCPRIPCKPKGCDCKDGYVFDDNVGKCVLPQECTPTCGLYEVYSNCTNGGCGHRNCSQLDQPHVCIDRTPESCIKGCICAPRYLRASNGTCIPQAKCPEAATPPCPEGEVYSRCPNVKCDGDYCPETRNSPLTCPVGIVCDKPRCVCGLLDRRDRKTGKCIRSSDCPPFKCDEPNEEYQSCPASCPGDTCTDYINHNAPCPHFSIGDVIPCKQQCRCTKGYYRNSDGICILASQCGRKTATTTAMPVIINTTPTAKPSTTDSGDSDGDDKNGGDSFETGITGFNGKFLYDRMKASEGENIITSPFSVFTPMAQLALYADVDCLKQLTNVLNLSSKQTIRNTFPALATSFDGQTSVNFSVAAKVYSNQQYPLSDGFKKDSIDVVNAAAQELDFSQNIDAADTINTWIESKTNNRVKDLISPSDISELTRLVLVNAIYFKGNWQYPFDKKNTKDADFYLSDGTTKQTMLMYQESRFNYGEIPELNCTALEMFYIGRNFSMVIVLPNDKDGVLKTAENLQNAGNFNKVLGSLGSNKVKVYVPPFEINTSTDLADILKQAGVINIFDATNSGLSGILKTPENTFVSKAIQKAFIKVDETGSEAAAANGLVVATTAAITPPRDIVFRCDHSFLYYITFRGTVLFSGAFVNPQ